MRGFSLLEALIYIALFSYMITSIFVISGQLNQIANTLQNKSYLQYEADFLFRKINLLLPDSAGTFVVTNGTLLYSTSSMTQPLSSTEISISNLMIATSSSQTTISFMLSVKNTSGKVISELFDKNFSNSL